MKTVRPLILHIPFAKHQAGVLFSRRVGVSVEVVAGRGRNKIACPTRAEV